jgi:non-lysosomal glucosylceramidase
MTGFEYTAAVGMLYEGMKEDGLKCIRAIRNRFDGEKRNPFDEIECGHHYARAMAAWSSVLALSDFHYSGVTKTMSFTSKPGLYFWSNGYAWGMCEITSLQVKLSVLCGKLDINKLMLDGINKTISKNIKMKEGDSLIFKY